MRRVLGFFVALILFQSCGNDSDPVIIEDPSTFKRVTNFDNGDAGAAEIVTYDAANQRLFVVNNASDSKIDIIDFSDPSSLSVIFSIDVDIYGQRVNSVAVGGNYLAAAIEAEEATDPGSIVIFDLSDLLFVTNVVAGALPKMVTFSHDNSYILSANEGEPSSDYLTDPLGSVTVVTVDDFGATTVDFSSFNSSQSFLEADGFRVTGLNANLAHDVEPEFIAVSPDSQTAYVSLQENNGLAIIDLPSQTITSLVGLGSKDYSLAGNEIDPNDEDEVVDFRTVPSNIFGLFMPDGIEAFSVGGETYLISANEGNGREYIYAEDQEICEGLGYSYDEEVGCLAFTDESRLADVVLDPTSFPDAATIQLEENFGRLKVMITGGDIDGDGDHDEVYSYGTRSFSIWDANGSLVFDSGSEIEKKINDLGLYDDDRSDDRGIEPKGVIIGEVNGQTIAFISLEGADAVAVYDVSNPFVPEFLSILKTGDAPEGLVFIPAEVSPTGSSILVVACEGSGSIWVYSTTL